MLLRFASAKHSVRSSVCGENGATTSALRSTPPAAFVAPQLQFRVGRMVLVLPKGTTSTIVTITACALCISILISHNQIYSAVLY